MYITKKKIYSRLGKKTNQYINEERSIAASVSNVFLTNH